VMAVPSFILIYYVAKGILHRRNHWRRQWVNSVMPLPSWSPLHRAVTYLPLTKL
jgi:hypothetical protein